MLTALCSVVDAGPLQVVSHEVRGQLRCALYIEQEATRAALTRTGGFLRGFGYSLNPYTGCAFGAGGVLPSLPRASVAGRARPRRSMGARVIAKTNLPQLLKRELAALARSGKLADATVFISSAPDPYQGVEPRPGSDAARARGPSCGIREATWWSKCTTYIFGKLGGIPG
jgi:hypothetical protein